MPRYASKRDSKYGNRKTAGYASAREAKRAAELKLLEKAGKIFDLREQPEFELIPAQYENGKCVERACKYKADFAYREGGPREPWVVEDAKGFRNRVYLLKRKLMLHVHGIRIREV
jgi:hypothetical protein